jgi:hypothetical protein
MMAVEIIILFLVMIAVIAVYIVFKAAKYLIVNTILGLIILVLGNVIFKLGITYSAPALLVCAIGGIPGAILVVLLHIFRIAF